MNETVKNNKVQFRLILILLKIFVVFGPLILVALIRVLGLSGGISVIILEISYTFASIILISLGVRQLAAGLRKLAYSSFIFAGVALFWILIFLFLLPSLAST